MTGVQWLAVGQFAVLVIALVLAGLLWLADRSVRRAHGRINESDRRLDAHGHIPRITTLPSSSPLAVLHRIYSEQSNGVLCLPPDKEVAEDVWVLDTKAAPDSRRYCKTCRQIWIDLEALVLSAQNAKGGSV